MDDILKIAGKEFSSRLFVGTGKYASNQAMLRSIKATKTDMVTLALKRVDLNSTKTENIAQVLEKEGCFLLPNTSGAKDSREAVLMAELAVELGFEKWVKLEIHPDPRYLLPDPIETLKATEELVNKGFIVLPYMNADPVLAKRLEEAGAATVMPLAAPIGSNKGLETRAMIKIIIEQSTIPVIVDAGLGAPSHACEAMEMGADAVLVNTALASCDNVEMMGEAFYQSVIAGRQAYLAGLGKKSDIAEGTSPLTSFLS